MTNFPSPNNPLEGVGAGKKRAVRVSKCPVMFRVNANDDHGTRGRCCLSHMTKPWIAVAPQEAFHRGREMFRFIADDNYMTTRGHCCLSRITTQALEGVCAQLETSRRVQKLRRKCFVLTVVTARGRGDIPVRLLPLYKKKRRLHPASNIPTDAGNVRCCFVSLRGVKGTSRFVPYTNKTVEDVCTPQQTSRRGPEMSRSVPLRRQRHQKDKGDSIVCPLSPRKAWEAFAPS